MTTRVGECKICGAFLEIFADGRMREHNHLKTGNPCRGRWPRKPSIDEYTVGWDHDPHDVSGGLPERNRSKF